MKSEKELEILAKHSIDKYDLCNELEHSDKHFMRNGFIMGYRQAESVCIHPHRNCFDNSDGSFFCSKCEEVIK